MTPRAIEEARAAGSRAATERAARIAEALGHPDVADEILGRAPLPVRPPRAP